MKRKRSNPVAKILLTSTEINCRPKIKQSKKKYSRNKEKLKKEQVWTLLQC